MQRFKSLWKRTKTAWQFVLPHQLLSYLAGKVATSQTQWLKNTLIKLFIRRFKVDMSEAERETVEAYAHFNDFFTRRLKPQSRQLPEAASQIASPVDGRISQLGTIKRHTLIQAKSIDYTLEALLADESWAHQFTHGLFLTLYLGPKNYHRVHMPIDAELHSMLYVPGRLFSVNPLSTETIPGLFTRNERVVLIFKALHGWMALVMVGALLIGQVEIAHEGRLMPIQGRQVRQWQYSQPRTLAKGEEVGHFLMGSSVIVLFSNQLASLSHTLERNGEVRLHEPLGVLSGEYCPKSSRLE